MEYFQLSDYKISAYGPQQTLILVRGSQHYKSLLMAALEGKTMSRIFPDNKNEYEWGAFIHSTVSSDRLAVKSFLNLMKVHIFIKDDLDQCFAIGHHSSGGGKTEVGSLVYDSKPYSKPATLKHRSSSIRLSELFIEFVTQNPTYSKLDMVLSIPALATKTFDLPLTISEEISKRTGISNGNGVLRKIKSTKPIKDCETAQEKIKNLQGAFSSDSLEFFSGKKILLIDDIYQSGFTMHEVASVLRSAGAQGIYGLVATKAGW